MYNVPMNTNGRSNSANSAHLITTTSQRRAALWDHIFSTDRLPVLHDAPRWQEQQGRAFSVLAYDLDTSRLTSMQRARFASHLARVERRPYLECVAEVNSGRTYPIKASFDIQIVEPAEQTIPMSVPLASSFLEQLRTIGGRLRQRPRLRPGW